MNTCALTAETLAPLRISDGKVWVLDQTLLPHEIHWVHITVYQEMIEAIRTMRIRGAPAIGVAGAFAVALAVQDFAAAENFSERLQHAVDEISSARPTAVNLTWACQKVQTQVFHLSSAQERIKKSFQAAQWIFGDDLERCRAIGQHGSALIESGDQILTICNAGGLATSGYGTAIGVIRWAAQSGKSVHVWVSETRPRLQGAKLTALELHTLKIPYCIITDNTAGYLMAEKKVSKVITGADRIAKNGDTANKIGTYTLAVLAKAHKIPFYVAAPFSTIDLDTPSGKHIAIEQRSPEEVLCVNGSAISLPQSQALNMAFDITPHELISGIITEKGVMCPPFFKITGR